MQNYVFFTDSSCDLPANVFNTEGAQYYGLSYTIDGNMQIQHSLNDDVGTKAFYSAIRQGKLPQTSQINVEEFKGEWEPILQSGKDVLYYGLSGGLSGTYSSACLAAKDLMEKYPDRRVEVVDSLSGSGILGLVYYLGLKKYMHGASLDELKMWLEQIRMCVIGLYTADDLNHLKRGGRITAAAASFGTLLNIKPLLTMNNDGHVQSIEKIKTRKKVLKRMVDLLTTLQVKNAGDLSDTIQITHGDCEQDALDLKEQILKKNKNIRTVIISDLGPIIGTHLGANSISVNFIGKERLG